MLMFRVIYVFYQCGCARRLLLTWLIIMDSLPVRFYFSLICYWSWANMNYSVMITNYEYRNF